MVHRSIESVFCLELAALALLFFKCEREKFVKDEGCPWTGYLCTPAKQTQLQDHLSVHGSTVRCPGKSAGRMERDAVKSRVMGWILLSGFSSAAGMFDVAPFLFPVLSRGVCRQSSGEGYETPSPQTAPLIHAKSMLQANLHGRLVGSSYDTVRRLSGIQSVSQASKCEKKVARTVVALTFGVAEIAQLIYTHFGRLEFKAFNQLRCPVWLLAAKYGIESNTRRSARITSGLRYLECNLFIVFLVSRWLTDYCTAAAVNPCRSTLCPLVGTQVTRWFYWPPASKWNHLPVWLRLRRLSSPPLKSCNWLKIPSRRVRRTAEPMAEVGQMRERGKFREFIDLPAILHSPVNTRDSRCLFIGCCTREQSVLPHTWQYGIRCLFPCKYAVRSVIQGVSIAKLTSVYMCWTPLLSFCEKTVLLLGISSKSAASLRALMPAEIYQRFYFFNMQTSGGAVYWCATDLGCGRLWVRIPVLNSHFGTKIDESEIQNQEISLVQHFYIATKIKLDPGMELGSFDLGSEMMVQPGIRNGTRKKNLELCNSDHHGEELMGKSRIIDLEPVVPPIRYGVRPTWLSPHFLRKISPAMVDETLEPLCTSIENNCTRYDPGLGASNEESGHQLLRDQYSVAATSRSGICEQLRASGAAHTNLLENEVPRRLFWGNNQIRDSSNGGLSCGLTALRPPNMRGRGIASFHRKEAKINVTLGEILSPNLAHPRPQKPRVWSGRGSIHTPSASPGHNRSRLPLTARSVNEWEFLQTTSSLRSQPLPARVQPNDRSAEGTSWWGQPIVPCWIQRITRSLWGKCARFRWFPVDAPDPISARLPFADSPYHLYGTSLHRYKTAQTGRHRLPRSGQKTDAATTDAPSAISWDTNKTSYHPLHIDVSNASSLPPHHLEPRVKDAIQTVTPDTLTRVWNKIEYRVDVVRAACGDLRPFLRPILLCGSPRGIIEEAQSPRARRREVMLSPASVSFITQHPGYQPTRPAPFKARVSGCTVPLHPLLLCFSQILTLPGWPFATEWRSLTCGCRPIPEKARQPAASSGKIPTCENVGVSPPGIEPGSPRWEESSRTTTPPRPLVDNADMRPNADGLCDRVTGPALSRKCCLSLSGSGYRRQRFLRVLQSYRPSKHVSSRGQSALVGDPLKELELEHYTHPKNSTLGKCVEQGRTMTSVVHSSGAARVNFDTDNRHISGGREREVVSSKARTILRQCSLAVRASLLCSELVRSRKISVGKGAASFGNTRSVLLQSRYKAHHIAKRIVSLPFACTDVVSIPRRRTLQPYEQIPTRNDRGRIVAHATTVKRVWDQWVEDGRAERSARDQPPRCSREREDGHLVRIASTDVQPYRTPCSGVQSCGTSICVRTHGSPSLAALASLVQAGGHYRGLLWCVELRAEGVSPTKPSSARTRVWRHHRMKTLWCTPSSPALPSHTGPGPDVTVWDAIGFQSRSRIMHIAGTLTNNGHIVEPCVNRAMCDRMWHTSADCSGMTTSHGFIGLRVCRISRPLKCVTHGRTAGLPQYTHGYYG
ncbi:hypothetical protein PR048_022003 [Dryococelus australis]|uniref:Uncharacterized protein n=1 Tax=Dryococelus australis TaxID=614101 RepID=A0ABQ9GZT6_9NEOP|nr:hypothetical protein PR048_022003 [Dryococelus australis]